MTTAQRPPASIALWAHLLRRDGTALPSSDTPASSSPSYTPVAPIDRNGASMRILLLDASHNLEKFSARVDQLISGVDHAKAEMVSLHKLFRNEHEELSNGMLDLGEGLLLHYNYCFGRRHLDCWCQIDPRRRSGRIYALHLRCRHQPDHRSPSQQSTDVRQNCRSLSALPHKRIRSTTCEKTSWQLTVD